MGDCGRTVCGMQDQRAGFLMGFDDAEELDEWTDPVGEVASFSSSTMINLREKVLAMVVMRRRSSLTSLRNPMVLVKERDATKFGMSCMGNMYNSEVYISSVPLLMRVIVDGVLD
jgi:hypothetical protein